MFDDFKERQAVLMKSIDGTYEAKMVKFAKMQDEFFLKWDIEIEELQDALQFYIS